MLSSMITIASETFTSVSAPIQMGLVLAGVVVVIGKDPTVAGIAALAVFGTITMGATLGVMTPILLDRIGVDPAVATSPFVTTMNDIIGSTMIILAALALL